MNKIIVPSIALTALLAVPLFATDADTTWRDSVRLGQVTSLFSTAVSFPGNVTIASNLAVSTIAAQSTVNVNGDLTVSTNFIKMSASGDITAANSITNAGVLTQTGASVFNGTQNFRGATTATNVTTLSLNARKVISSKDNTTSYVIESGSATGTQVITYTTAFSATPQVFISAVTAAPVGTDATNFFPIQTNPRTNFTTTALGTTSFNWLAIGAK